MEPNKANEYPLHFERQTETEKINKFLSKENTENNTTGTVKVLTIHGYGGVGKTYLWDHINNSVFNLSKNNYLPITFSATNSDKGSDFCGLFEQAINKACINTRRDYKNKIIAPKFDRMKKIIRKARELEEQIINNKNINKVLEKQLDSNNFTEEEKKIAREGFKRVVESGSIRKKDLEDTKELIKRVSSFLEFASKFSEPSKLGLLLKLSPIIASILENNLPQATNLLKGILDPDTKNLTKDFDSTIANCLIENLKTITDQRINISNSDEEPLFKNLMFIFDDFEYIGFYTLKEFIVLQLPKVISALKGLYEDITIVLISRSPVIGVNMQDRRFRDWLTGIVPQEDRYRLSIEVKPYTEDETLELLQSAGGITVEQALQVYESTSGLPYLVEAEYQILKDHGGKISAYEIANYIERITQWMNESQKMWFIYLCYLDIINIDNIKKILCSVNEFELDKDEDIDILSEKIYQWFIAEPSICSRKSEDFKVLEVVRIRCKKNIVNKSPLEDKFYKNLVQGLNHKE